MSTKHLTLTHFERVAGLFVASAFLGMVAVFIAVGVKKGWFESKVYFFTEIEDSEGLRAGSQVQLAGLHIGEVSTIEMGQNDRLRVKIAILKRYRERIRQGVRIQLIRPFVIGEKALYLSTPEEPSSILPELSSIPAEEVVGLTELLNGRKFLPYVQTMAGVFSEMKRIADLLLKRNEGKSPAGVLQALPQFMTQINRLTNELTKLASQMNDGENLRKVIRSLGSASDAMSSHLPEIAEATPKVAQDFTVLVTNLALLTEEFKKVLPALAEVAPELPRSSRRMIEALDEAVVVLKAMQKSFLLRGSAEEVREEELARQKKEEPATHSAGEAKGKREPASSSWPKIHSPEMK